MGFGDDLFVELFKPSLTVFNHFPTQVGEASIKMLIENINKKDEFLPYTQSIQGELIVRASSNKKELS